MPVISETLITRRTPPERRDLNDDLERRGDLAADDPDRHFKSGHAHHHLQPAQRITGVVGVDGRHAAVVAGVHRLEHVERLGTAALADDDAIGPHSQGVPDQVAGGHLALSLDVCRSRLHPHHVWLLEP